MNKTHDRVLKHFFWPGLKWDVAKYCETCPVCQVTGKPNQKILPAPLYPIPVVGELFGRVLIDCVGPLPRTKSGNQYLLPIMCAATHFTEAIPLRKITSPVIVKALFDHLSAANLTCKSGKVCLAKQPLHTWVRLLAGDKYDQSTLRSSP